MKINPANSFQYRIMLDLVKKKMEKKEVKPASKADNEEKPKKDGKYI